MKKLVLIALFSICCKMLPAQSGNALYFDNVDDFVSVPNGSSYIANSSAFAMTFWVYPQNTVPVYPDLEGFGGFRNNTNADFYILQLNGTDIEARFRNSAGTPFDIVYSGLQMNTWQHFILSYDGINMNLYHNGVIVGTVPANGTITLTTEPFFIGKTPWTGAEFNLNGRVDEVSLWNKALTQPEIDCIFNGAIDPSAADLAFYYRCNQGVAGGINTGLTSLIDATATANGTLSGFSLTGPVSNWNTGYATANSSFAVDTICPGATYIFGSQVLTGPGNYYEAFPSSGTCDSIVELSLVTVPINLTISQVGPSLTAMQSGASYQWINCGTGNSVIPGATSQTYVATANGQYGVIVTLGGCSDTTVCANVTNVGINEINGMQISVGPNPFTDIVSLRLPESVISKNMMVYDVNGREIYNRIIETNHLSLDVSSWNAGVYYLAIEGTTGRVKLLKK